MLSTSGLHHITAVAGDPQKNVDFYRLVLGQRLVKTTINFDDPGTYHFYFGDAVGTPGSILTFFPWRHVPQGRPGNGETAAIAYVIRPEALPYWQTRLGQFGLTVERKIRFGTDLLSFSDPDGMALELVASAVPGNWRNWAEGPIPEPYALRGFFGVTLQLGLVEATAALLTQQLGYTLAGREEHHEGVRHRYQAPAGAMGTTVDILHRPAQPRGQFGAGSIHHIAFRAVSDEEQLQYQERLRHSGQSVTPVKDRQYFRSIYFREPGGVLFEIATDGPGFASDESVSELGDNLKLPPWLEPQRSRIEAILPSFERRPVTNATEVNLE